MVIYKIICCPPACAGVADITFVLDSSGSLGLDGWNALVKFVADVVRNMHIGRYYDICVILACIFDNIHIGMHRFWYMSSLAKYDNFFCTLLSYIRKEYIKM